jgi:hypothetical protein
MVALSASRLVCPAMPVISLHLPDLVLAVHVDPDVQAAVGDRLQGLDDGGQRAHDRPGDQQRGAEQHDHRDHDRDEHGALHRFDLGAGRGAGGVDVRVEGVAGSR